MTGNYVLKLVGAYPEISEVWLLGSRAQGTARSDSDWDYLVFGSHRVLRSLRQRNGFNVPEVDLLVVYDGNNFSKPWRDGNRVKGGSLKDWDWRRISDERATYRAAKFREGSDFYMDISTAQAYRVWPGLAGKSSIFLVVSDAPAPRQ